MIEVICALKHVLNVRLQRNVRMPILTVIEYLKTMFTLVSGGGGGVHILRDCISAVLQEGTTPHAESARLPLPLIVVTAAILLIGR